MAACAGILLQEGWSPLLPDVVNPAIIHFQQIQAPWWQLSVICIAAIELARARIGWEPPTNSLFTLREEYTPGDLQFDPLSLHFLFRRGMAGARDAELQLGRLAMLAAVAMVVEEVATAQPTLMATAHLLGLR